MLQNIVGKKLMVEGFLNIEINSKEDRSISKIIGKKVMRKFKRIDMIKTV